MTHRLRIEVSRLAKDSLPPIVMTFRRFPVIIGRDSSCDCKLLFSFVSRVHARLSVRDDGRVILHDEGGRNGVRVNGERLASYAAVDLTARGGEFEISTLRLRVSVEPAGDDADGDDDEPCQPSRPIAASTHLYCDRSVDPRAVDDDSVYSQAVLLVAEARALRTELSGLIKTLGADRREAMESRLSNDGDAPWLADWLADGGGTIPARAALALRVLQELSSEFAPDAPPLGAPACVLGFAERLAAVLRVLMDGVAAVRFGYACETRSGELDPSGLPLSRELFDWTSGSTDALRALEEELLALVRHHAQLVSQVSRGVEQLAEELSPRAIAEATRAAPWQSRDAACWRVYRITFARIFAEDALRRVLGERFAGARAALAGEDASGMFEADRGPAPQLARGCVG